MMGNPFGAAGEWPDRLDQRRVRWAMERGVRYRAAMVRLMLKRARRFVVALFVNPAAGTNTGAWQA